NRLVQVTRLDQVKARHLLFGLRVRAIRHRGSALAHPHASARATHLERFGFDELPTRQQAIVELEMPGVQRIRLRVGHFAQLLLVQIDQAQVSHRAFPTASQNPEPIMSTDPRAANSTILPLVEWRDAISTTLGDLFFELGQTPLEESALGRLASQ